MICKSLFMYKKKHLHVIKRLSGGRKFIIQQDGVRSNTANSVTNCLNENVLDYVRKENWLPNSYNLNPIDNAICVMMGKIVHKT